MIQGIIFDLDGVYFKNGTKNFLDTVSLTYDISRSAVAQVYLKSEEMQEYKKGKVTADKYYDELKDLTVEIIDDDIKQASEMKHHYNKKKLSYVDCLGYTIAR
jgi:hypothetical protein